MRPKNRISQFIGLLVILGGCMLPVNSYSEGDKSQNTAQTQGDNSDRGCSPVINQITW